MQSMHLVASSRDFGDQQSAVSDGHSATSSTTHHTTNSTWVKIQSSIATLTVALQDKKRKTSWKYFALIVIMNIYLMWTSIFLPTLGSAYNWGEYGDWVFKVANYPITFSLDLIPYIAMVVLEIVSIVYVLLYLTTSYLAFQAVNNSSKQSVRIKRMSIILSWLTVFLTPVMSFIFTSFIDCNLSSLVTISGYDEQKYTLQRFPTQACYSVENIAFIVIGFVGHFLLVGSVFYAHLAIANMHPHNMAPLRMESSFSISCLMSFNSFELLCMYVIPPQYAYIRSITHLIISIGWIIIFFNQLPFFKRVENSIYLGVGGAKIGASTGSLISAAANSTNSWPFGLGMMGMTLALITIGFLVGLIVGELYTRIVLRMVEKLIHNIILEKQSSETVNISLDRAIERDALTIYQEMDESNLLRQLGLFLRFSIVNTKTNSINPEINMPLSFVKGIANQKSFSESGLLISSALIIAYDWNDENSLIFATLLLKKAAKHANILQKVVVSERITEIEIDATESKNGKNMVEVKHILERMTRYQEELKALHRLFWKELMNEIPNMQKVEQTNRRIAYLTDICHVTYLNVMSNYSKEKTVLRSYASFLDAYLFDKELAQELFQEATSIEEDESNKRNRSKNHYLRNVSKFKFLSKGSIHPSHIGDDFVRNSFDSAGNRDIDMEKDDGMSFSGIEGKEVSKKETIFKSALRVPPSHKFQMFSLYIVIFLSLLATVVGSVLAYFLSFNIAGEIPMQFDTCRSTMSTAGILRQLRMHQSSLQVYNSSYKTTSTLDMFHNDFMDNHDIRLENYINMLKRIPYYAQAALYTPAMYEFYTKDNISVVVPFIPETSTVQNFISSFKRNASMEEINNIIIRISENILNNWQDKDYNTPLSNFEFMYMWQNKIPLGGFYTTFCESLINANYSDSSSKLQAMMICLLSICFTYFALFVVFCGLSRLELTSTERILKLYEKVLNKNVIGKAYHDLGSNDDATIHLSKNIFLIPKNFIPLFGFVCVVLVFLSFGMMYYETSVNVNNTHVSGSAIKDGTALIRVVHRMVYRVSEYFTYFSLPSGLPNNDPLLTTQTELIGYRANVKAYLTELNNRFNMLVYGYGGKQEVVGTYEKVDQLLKGVANCSHSYPNATFIEEFQHCYGIEKMISIFASDTAQLNERFWNAGFYNRTIEAYTLLFKLFAMGDKLSDQMNIFMTTFVQYASTPSVTIISVFTIFSLLSLLLLNYQLYLSMVSHFSHVQSLRSMLNYIPLNILDSNEHLRNFILYNSVPNGLVELFQRKNKKQNSGDSSNVRSILNASVDGSILCNESGLIDLINPAAQRMFGYKQSDIVGAQVFTMFEKKDRELLEKTVADLKAQAKGNGEANAGESLELECVRRNQTTFPSSVNIFVALFDGIPVLAFIIKDVTQEKKHNALLAEEKSKSEHLLRNILPEAVAAKLKAGETFIAEKFGDITCFFSDMVGFTSLSSDMNPTELVGMLNNIVNGFDALTDKYHLEKIKTIGDAYFAVGGLHANATSDHPERTLRFAIDTFTVIHDYNITAMNPISKQINIRIGLNTGGVIAGVIGTKKFAYDLWGDTINTASRMESTSKPGRIQVSRSTYERVYDLGFDFEERKVEVKGKGLCNTYLLNSRHHTNAVIENDEPSNIQILEFKSHESHDHYQSKVKTAHSIATIEEIKTKPPTPTTEDLKRASSVQQM
ncbi:predicted protein [Naegleria gruberi]|uniref:Predicted protein n=1 Tax=Naegleria gruberi TaxID=5762 RepID=D2V025_NAEGR|nr:uncharacterized protein NAEGRDRAFT_62145 [Naegleria gruberi]EFC49455.1 predicted protein [Naegleria gruberi]|eukprot:XP_002682199.1 predicted protein [Naegleria gruberi strain NEG-M]